MMRLFKLLATLDEAYKITMVINAGLIKLAKDLVNLISQMLQLNLNTWYSTFVPRFIEDKGGVIEYRFSNWKIGNIKNHPCIQQLNLEY